MDFPKLQFMPPFSLSQIFYIYDFSMLQPAVLTCYYVALTFRFIDQQFLI